MSFVSRREHTMLMVDEVMIGLECEPSEFVDPEVRATIKDVDRQLATAGISPINLVHARSGAVMASLSSLGPYIVPVAQITLPTLGVILVAWLRRPRRKVKVKIGDTLIEATSVEDVEQLLPRLQEFQARTTRKKAVK